MWTYLTSTQTSAKVLFMEKKNLTNKNKSMDCSDVGRFFFFSLSLQTPWYISHLESITPQFLCINSAQAINRKHKEHVWCDRKPCTTSEQKKKKKKMTCACTHLRAQTTHTSLMGIKLMNLLTYRMLHETQCVPEKTEKNGWVLQLIVIQYYTTWYSSYITTNRKGV